ncbi:hypothetical protein OIU77_016617 [Salix suchowensis]|uniref:DWD hypersensitive to UV-B 1 N-terminal domain-containing protein n=1 Tax=Salix suchowensis TaxID=1278906 RepID=A0ABQ8ZLH3_9ROSI|nr:hypothetical protein OIU77_016617 [Salix suchowensis]
MATDIPSFNISTLEQMYIDSCKRHDVPPNKEILSGFLKAEVKKSCNEICSLEIILDHLEDIDVPPLLDVCASIETSEIEVVDIRNGPLCALQGEYALSLMRAFNQKLQLVDLQDLPFGKDFLRYIVVLIVITCIMLLMSKSSKGKPSVSEKPHQKYPIKKILNRPRLPKNISLHTRNAKSVATEGSSTSKAARSCEEGLDKNRLP